MRPSALDRLPTVWQWLITGALVVVLHALVLRNLQLPAPTNTSKVINRIEVELSAPPRALQRAAPPARLTSKPEPVLKRDPPRPARPQRHANPKPAEREPSPLPTPTTPAPPNEPDEMISSPAGALISRSWPTEKSPNPPEDEPLTAPHRLSACSAPFGASCMPYTI